MIFSVFSIVILLLLVVNLLLVCYSKFKLLLSSR
nr:MAG TPA: hypothetical protein [Caudoviricetes sp.]